MCQRQLSSEVNRKRNIAFWTVIVAVLLLCGISVCLEQFGGDELRLIIQRIYASADSVGRYLMLAAIGLVLLLVLMLWLKRDRHLIQVAKLALAKDYDGAIVHVQSVIQSKGATLNRLNALGLLYLEQQRPQAALEQFESAMRQFGPNPASRNNRAMALRQLGRFDEALMEMEQITGPDCKDVVVLCNYAVSLAESKRETEGYQQLLRAEMILARYDPRYLPTTWTAAVDDAKAKLPLAHGFPVPMKSATDINKPHPHGIK